MPPETNLLPATVFFATQALIAIAMLIRHHARQHFIGAVNEHDPYPHVPR
jgi:hypothetical protein